MDAFLAAWLDELSAMDALRLCAACRSAREALGADGVAAAAFAVTRPWTASCLPNPAGSLRLWRKAWEACSIASSAFQMRGGAWLKTATVIPANSSVRPTDVAVTLDFASARSLAEYGMEIWSLPSTSLARKVIAVLLISGKDATFLTGRHATCHMELHMLVLFEDSQFGALIVAHGTGQVQLTPNPLDVCDRVIADGFDSCLLVPEKKARPPGWCYLKISVPLKMLSSGMKRVAPDGEAYDFFDFMEWYDGGSLATGRWREAPPLAEVQDEREIALEGMLTRRSSPASAAASGAPPEPDEDTVPIDPNLQRFLEAEESIHGMMPDPDDDGSDVEGVGGDDTQRDERYYENLRNSMRFSEA